MANLIKTGQDFENLREMFLTEIEGLTEKQMDWDDASEEWSLWSIRRQISHVALASFFWLSKAWGTLLWPAAPPADPDVKIHDLDLLALNLHYDASPLLSLGLVGVADLEAGSGRQRFTAGLIATGKTCDCFSYSAEGYYQTGGADGDVSYAAWLAAAKARYTAPAAVKPFVELFAEALSGDDDPADGDVKTFDTLYATNHKFYGEMDFYLNTPKHTGGRGLMDVGGAAGLNILGNLAIKTTGHYFAAMDDQGAGERAFGSEVDVRLDWKVSPHVKLDVVYAIFLPGEIMESSTGGSDPENFAYSTLDVSF